MHQRKQPDMRNRTFFPAFLLVVIVFALNSCSQKIVLNGTQVITSDKKPVSGALVYVEIWRNNKPVNFTFGVTAADGTIPSKPVIPIPLGSGGMASLAVFADGFAPTVFSRAIVDGKYQQKELTVQVKTTSDVMEPGELAFPFDEYPALFKKLKDPVFKPLIIKWLQEWSFIFDKYDSLPLYLQKRMPKMKIAIEELKKCHEIR